MPHKKKQTTIRTCRGCGKSFSVDLAYIRKHGDKKYHNVDCFKDARAKDCLRKAMKR
jgi:hypothetical protein